MEDAFHFGNKPLIFAGNFENYVEKNRDNGIVGAFNYAVECSEKRMGTFRQAETCCWNHGRSDEVGFSVQIPKSLWKRRLQPFNEGGI